MCKWDEKSWTDGKCSRFACVYSCVQLTQLAYALHAWCSCYIQREPLGHVDSHHMLQNVLYFLNFIDTNDCITRTQPICCMEAHRSPSKLCMPVPAPIMTLGLCLIGGLHWSPGQTVLRSDCHHWTPNHTWPLIWVDNQHSNTSASPNYNHHSLAVGCGAGSRSCSIMFWAGAFNGRQK